MRKIGWQLLLVLWPYAGIAMLEILRRFASWTFVPVLVWMLGMVFICGLNAVHALRTKEGAAVSGMAVKLALIPYYVVSCAYGVMLIAAPPAVLMLCLLNGLLLLATSAYTLRGVYLAWRGGRLPGGWAIVLAVSQCIFVLDVPGSIALYAIEKRRSC